MKPPICFLTYVKKSGACSYHRTVLRMITERITQHLRRTTLSFRPHAEKRNGYRCREVRAIEEQRSRPDGRTVLAGDIGQSHSEPRLGHPAQCCTAGARLCWLMPSRCLVTHSIRAEAEKASRWLHSSSVRAQTSSVLHQLDAHCGSRYESLQANLVFLADTGRKTFLETETRMDRLAMHSRYLFSETGAVNLSRLAYGWCAEAAG